MADRIEESGGPPWGQEIRGLRRHPTALPPPGRVSTEPWWKGRARYTIYIHVRPRTEESTGDNTANIG